MHHRDGAVGWQGAIAGGRSIIMLIANLLQWRELYHILPPVGEIRPIHPLTTTYDISTDTLKNRSAAFVGECHTASVEAMPATTIPALLL